LVFLNQSAKNEFSAVAVAAPLNMVVVKSPANARRIELSVKLGNVRVQVSVMALYGHPCVIAADTDDDTGHGVISGAGGVPPMSAVSIADFGASVTTGASTGARLKASFISRACCSPRAVQSAFI
jgi:hypothetical protein